MNPLILIILFGLALWLGFILGKDAGLNELNQTLERLANSKKSDQ